MIQEETLATPEYVKSSGGICERLWTATCDMLNSTLRLEDALINRRIEEIWSILAEQENKAAQLNQATQLWHQVYADNWENSSSELLQARKEIRSKLMKLQIAERVNNSLTRSYLNAVNKSMIQTGAGIAGKKKVYNKGGRLGIKSSSMLFKSIG
ncbi:MAG: hypothetical protein HRT88_12505 [Lentisphaeraceae bacterium]|nr:hypothetical protein [Lentisphaeraceae bacterium]